MRLGLGAGNQRPRVGFCGKARHRSQFWTAVTILGRSGFDFCTFINRFVRVRWQLDGFANIVSQKRWLRSGTAMSAFYIPSR